MKKTIQSKICIFFILSWLALFTNPDSSYSKTSSVQTAYKRYTIIKYNDADILCEPYTVSKNDWLYKILRKKGEISEKDFPLFISIFKEINPEISNIDAIQSGIAILIPLKKINKEDYKLATPENIDVPVVGITTQDKKKDTEENIETRQMESRNLFEAHKLASLKKYASLIDGVLLNQGKFYFPGKTDSSYFLDLSTFPVIETNQGERIIITSDDSLSDDLLENIQSYWKNLKTQSIFDTLKKLNDDQKPPAAILKSIKKTKKTIHSLLSQAGFEYSPDVKIPFSLYHINLEATFDRISRKNSADLLINYGNVYGAALDVLKKQNFEIITINSDLDLLKALNILFSSLGYSVSEDPSFFSSEEVEKILGLYAAKQDDRVFIPTQSLSKTAASYLEKEKIRVLFIDYEIPSHGK